MKSKKNNNELLFSRGRTLEVPYRCIFHLDIYNIYIGECFAFFPSEHPTADTSMQKDQSGQLGAVIHVGYM